MSVCVLIRHARQTSDSRAISFAKAKVNTLAPTHNQSTTSVIYHTNTHHQHHHRLGAHAYMYVYVACSMYDDDARSLLFSTSHTHMRSAKAINKSRASYATRQRRRSFCVVVVLRASSEQKLQTHGASQSYKYTEAYVERVYRG